MGRLPPWRKRTSPGRSARDDCFVYIVLPASSHSRRRPYHARRSGQRQAAAPGAETAAPPADAALVAAQAQTQAPEKNPLFARTAAAIGMSPNLSPEASEMLQTLPTRLTT